MLLQEAELCERLDAFRDYLHLKRPRHRQDGRGDRAITSVIAQILDEGAIRRVVGGPSVMRQQLEALIEAASRTNVVLQVLSFDSGAHAGMDGPFAIVGFREPSDPDVAVVDSIGGTQVFLEKDKEVRTRIEAFDRMRAAALSPPATIRLIQSVMSELG